MTMSRQRPREILDSDDEGSVFGDSDYNCEQTLDMLPDTQDASYEANHEVVLASHAATESTDPSFFQRVYDAQYAAVAGQPDESGLIPDTLPGKDWVSVGTDTGPATATTSQRKRRRGRIQETDVVDLTSPTPLEKNNNSDVWDVPNSAPRQRNKRTYGRQRDTESDELAPTQDPFAVPEETPRLKRTRVRRGEVATQSSSPVMLVPSNTAEGGADSSSVNTEAGPSLYIPQSELAASQKQECQVVSLSPAEGSEVVSDTFAHQHQPTSSEIEEVATTALYKSSGMTTIAYPTPSRVKSSLRRREGQMEAQISGWGVYEPPQSSPDVLADLTSTENPKAKRTKAKVVSSTVEEKETPPSIRLPKKRRVVQDEDEGYGDWQQVTSMEQHINDQALSEEVPEGGADEQFGDQSVAPPALESPEIATKQLSPPVESAPKKRGRPRKRKFEEDMTPAQKEPAPVPTEPEAPVPPAKRKRGRLRKSEVKPTDDMPAQPAVETEADAIGSNPETLTEVQVNPQPVMAQPTEDSRHKEETADSSESKENNGNGPSKPATAKDSMPAKRNVDEYEETPIPKEEDMEDGGSKEAATPAIVLPKLNLGMKAQYRVGLSKKSKIAPLLKSLKRPTSTIS
ncbi:uncharacterized protein CTHT_0002910 [Thermochaetoides thermophila DSM 1495]|uniref:AT hook domain-containing protein n=1 Tax=Chaetomium thermophilum (strain DSM 1495 / CBS 144.50 / IMI 039719) TaxID=759272 RepID=G0RZG8_CHATD|nr:hypothetical protein CTHT_0002910 [Thermochaetoides thermophila DSM 1495]EGS23596.1 hypothetical protein CTHT_0002910 [Thermochaetoides thermophila DSM 1495]